jgi:hypothetical protein
MSSAAQISANIANAQLSTGPRTDGGKTACSKNATTHGLFTAADFIKPGEEPIYAELRHALLNELAPQGILENTLVDEIRRATWRLRRCGEVEAGLAEPFKPGAHLHDPMETPHPHAEKIQKSVDRARSQAHRLLHKCTAELRKLQATRRAQQPVTPAVSITRTAMQPLGLNCKPHSTPTPRNADCPCGSHLKYKRCCGKNAPPVLQLA